MTSPRLRFGALLLAPCLTLACPSGSSSGQHALGDDPGADAGFPVSGGCGPEVSADCQSLGAVCDPSSGACVECLSNSDCALFSDAPTCNTASETCVQCMSAADCTYDSPGCGDGLCGGCNADTDCPNGQTCNGASTDGPGSCVCAGNSNCGGDAPVCIPFLDGGTSICGCSQDADCPGGSCEPPDDVTHQLGFCVSGDGGMFEEDGGEPADGGSPTCMSDSDCTGNPATPHCDPNGNCVGCVSDGQCLDGGACTNETCGCSGSLSYCGSGCTDTTQDTANCGACGNACAGVQPNCCGGNCVDTYSDPQNCGSCSASCNGNNCCASNCSDPITDSQNCGGCGTVCSSGTCTDGGCM